MTLLKFLKIFEQKKAQATLEYFLLFCVIIVLTLVSTSTLLPRVNTIMQQEVQSLSNSGTVMYKLIHADEKSLLLEILETLARRVQGLINLIFGGGG